MSNDPWADAKREAERRDRLRKAAIRLLGAIDGCVGGGPYRYDERADEVVEAITDIVDDFLDVDGRW